MAQYDFIVEHPPRQVMRDRETAIEVNSLVVYADWQDDDEAVADNDFVVEAVADQKRFKETWDLADSDFHAEVQNLGSDGDKARRRFAELTAQPGLWGTLLSVKLTKRIPVDGAFKLFGVKVKGFSRTSMQSENYYKSSGRANAW
jgi:hypothetical protein